MVWHSWIVQCLDMVGMSEQIKHFLSQSMKAWRVEWIWIKEYSWVIRSDFYYLRSALFHWL